MASDYEELAAKYRAAGMLLLPLGITDTAQTYIMADPDDAAGSAALVHHALNEGRTLDPVHVRRLVFAAQSYDRLTRYPLGVENCIRVLRDIWRAMRARVLLARAEEATDGEE